MATNEPSYTDGWLRSLGFDNHEAGVLSIRSKHYGEHGHHLRHSQISIHRNGWRVNGLGCETPRSRLDVIALLDLVLGIEIWRTP
jgi:hypothetical protein